MKLYHVSYDPIPWFVLRVPDHRLPDEDCTTPRICLGDSVENCVNAKPDQATAMYLAKQFGVRIPMYVQGTKPNPAFPSWEGGVFVS